MSQEGKVLLFPAPCQAVLLSHRSVLRLEELSSLAHVNSFRTRLILREKGVGGREGRWWASPIVESRQALLPHRKDLQI